MADLFWTILIILFVIVIPGYAIVNAGNEGRLREHLEPQIRNLEFHNKFLQQTIEKHEAEIKKWKTAASWHYESNLAWQELVESREMLIEDIRVLTLWMKEDGVNDDRLDSILQKIEEEEIDIDTE